MSIPITPPTLRKREMLIVVYALTGVPSAYSQLYEALNNLGMWSRYIPNMWIIDTEKTPSEMYEAIKPHLLTADHVFIGTLQDGYWGSLPKDAWDWLKNHGLSAFPRDR